MIPNLLNIALGAICGQTVTWRAFKARTQNGRGHWITTYEDDQPIMGSWQTVDSRTIKELGLDTAKRYHNLYCSYPINQVREGTSPDLIIADGYIHEVVGGPDWYRLNGWRGILCVEIGPDPAPAPDPDPEPDDEPEST